MKKRISTLILAALMMALTVGTPALAEDAGPSISVQTVSAKPGTEVTLAVDVSNNPGFCAAKLKVNYDDTKLELKEITLGDGFDSGTPAVSSNTIAFYYAYDKTNDGTLLNLKFKVNENAADGMSQVSISYTAGDVCNRNEDDVTFTMNAGGVNISANLTPSMSVTSITHYGHTLSLSEIVFINKYVTINYTNATDNEAIEYIKKNGGLLVFEGEISKDNATYEYAQENGYIMQGLKYYKDKIFTQQSMGIPSRCYDQNYSFVVYVKLDNGEYFYSDPMTYNVNTYCDAMIKKDDTTSKHLKLVEVVKDMKSYGEHAKEYFNME